MTRIDQQQEPRQTAFSRFDEAQSPFQAARTVLIEESIGFKQGIGVVL